MQMPDEDYYGWSNSLEFLAEAFSDQGFVNVLNRIPSKTKRNSSLWKDVLDLLARMVGIRSDSVYADIINALEKAVVIQNKLENNKS